MENQGWTNTEKKRKRGLRTSAGVFVALSNGVRCLSVERKRHPKIKHET